MLVINIYFLRNKKNNVKRWGILTKEKNIHYFFVRLCLKCILIYISIDFVD